MQAMDKNMKIRLIILIGFAVTNGAFAQVKSKGLVVPTPCEKHIHDAVLVNQGVGFNETFHFKSIQYGE